MGIEKAAGFGVHSPCLGVPYLPGFRLFDFGYLHIHNALLRMEPRLRHQFIYVSCLPYPTWSCISLEYLCFDWDSSQEVKYRIFHLWHHVNLKFRSVSDEDAHVVYTVSNPIILLVPWLNLQLTTLTWGSPPACLKPHSPSSFHGVWFSSWLPCDWGCYHSLGHAQTMSSSQAHLPSDLHISLVTKSCLVCFQNGHTVTLSLKPWTPLPPTKWF